MRSHHTVRIKSAGHYASGLLLTRQHLDEADATLAGSISERASYILTADHFLRSCGTIIYIRGQSFNATATTSLSVFGTDLGLIKIDGKAPTMALPRLATTPIRIGTKTTTYGFGGQPNATVPKEIHGRVISTVPMGMSKNRVTRVTHGALVYNSPGKAVKGDSGGPVLIDGLVTGIQSMITDPGGWNTGVATIALISEHLPALRQAAAQLEP
ncbi:hypothetical protein CDES_07185 [Corynebacterium deserti GIMN1.010]|uniref:Peptidase S1 domain-containing protein n=1 Tax=Corynebacterium deserti GIMN1.010 TaxID=931089 RepID=A0A0M4CX96_9CORY|nr:S1C family serine protease [Corynebacterium deserti]ALC05850.1 hypothetical protein CDES_07185 [Corynebacterium deserti GIMN1.010]